MKQEIANRWVAALRSGEYAQGTQYLSPERNSYCCLGVLTDLYLRESGLQWGSASSVAYHDDTCLPVEVVSWSGMLSDCGALPDDTQGVCDTKAVALVDLNDGNSQGVRQHTFAEIADVIEKYWEVL